MLVIKNLLFVLTSVSLMAHLGVRTLDDRINKSLLHDYRVDTVPKDLSPECTITTFLKWYQQNEERLGQIRVLTGGFPDTTTFYRVDFREVELYLLELKNSGFLSNKLLNNLRLHFSKSDAYLKQHPENDGPATGFEADLIMKSQDYMHVWSNLNKSKVIVKKIYVDKATIKLSFGGCVNKYSLIKKGTKWLIDSLD